MTLVPIIALLALFAVLSPSALLGAILAVLAVGLAVAGVFGWWMQRRRSW